MWKKIIYLLYINFNFSSSFCHFLPPSTTKKKLINCKEHQLEIEAAQPPHIILEKLNQHPRDVEPLLRNIIKYLS